MASTTRKRADGSDSGVPDEPTMLEPHPILPHVSPRPAPTNIIEAIARVEAEIGGIQKFNPAQRAQLGMGGGEGEGIKYAYRGIDQIASEAQPLFGKYGVVIVPTLLGRDTREIPTRNGGSMLEHYVMVRWDLYGPGGITDMISSTVEGEARDSGDKGLNKAMTAAFKNLLLRILCIGDPQDDTDNYNTADAGAPAPRGRSAPNPAGGKVDCTQDQWAEAYGKLVPKQKNVIIKYGRDVIGVKNFSEPGDELRGAMMWALTNVLADREPGQGPVVGPAEPDPVEPEPAEVEPAVPGAESADAEAASADHVAPGDCTVGPDGVCTFCGEPKKHTCDWTATRSTCTVCGKEEPF